MTEHYDCGGELVAQSEGAYACQQCGATVRASVVTRSTRFKRVAESNGPASEIATEALHGV